MSLTPFVHVDSALSGCSPGDQVLLTAQEQHHLSTVLRLRPPATVELADGQGSRTIGVLGEQAIRITGTVVNEPPPRPALAVIQALPKRRKMDEVVRQVTELGVDDVIATLARRSLVRLEGERARSAVERWAAVARAAAEQARRSRRPRVAGVAAVSELPAALSRTGDVVAGARAPLLLVAHPGSDALPSVLARHVDGVADADRPSTVAIAIGPEGGWCDDELVRMTAAGARLVGLGPTVMRTEHAAAAAIAVLAVLLGRWDIAPDAPISASGGRPSRGGTA